MSETYATEQTGEDPYQPICRAMEPGLLITVNCSDRTSTGIDEMEVLRVDSGGDVQLKAHSGELFLLTFNDPNHDGPVINEIGESEFAPIYERVTTIEVIGYV